MDGEVIIDSKINTVSFDAQIDQLEEKLEGLEEEYEAAMKDVDFPEDELKRYGAEIEKTTNQIIRLRKKQEDLIKSNLTQMPNMLSNIGGSIESVITKVGRWGLAVFGIRSAYMLIRQAMSQISAENDQIAGDIQYMKWILAQTLKPVVEWIIKGLYFIIALINSISKALLGIDFLADKGADAFKRAKENTGGISDNLKEARKQLAGFDEMNVLQEPSTGGGAGLGDWEEPDLGDYTQDVEKVANAWERLRGDMENTLSAPWEVWFEAFGFFGLAARGLTEFFHGFLDVVDGILKVVGGLFQFAWGLLTENDKLVNEGLKKMGDGVIEILKGLLEMIWGLIQTAVGIVVGIVWELVGSIIKILTDVGNWIGDNILTPIVELFAWGIEFEKKLFNDAINFVMGLWNGLWNGLIDGFNGAIKWVESGLNGLVNFFRGIINSIMGFFNKIGTGVGTAIGSAFKAVINGVLGVIENTLNEPIRAINSLIGVINAIPGINLKRLSTFKLPRLAKGGIVNNPGPGVMMGSYIAGERGPEAVLPLTDEVFDRLGRATAKYMVINANITNTMNGRVISRELQRINNESDFSFNR